MARMRNLSRSATRLVVLVPFAAMFAAACGGSDTIPDEDGGPDGAATDGSPLGPDGATADAGSPDGTLSDSGPVPDGALQDAAQKDGAIADGAGDAGDARDGAAVDAESTEDANADLDANDAGDSSDSASVKDASDAGDASDAAGDASVPTSILGSAALFAVFSGATVTNATGTLTTITGDVGTYPSNTAIGPTPPVVIGAEHLGDTVAQIAAGDLQNAYNRLIPGNLPCGTQLTGLDLGGKTLVPGVYCFSSSAGMTGTLTLDAQNNPNATWVFQVGSALTTAAGAKVVVINGTAGQVCNAFWQISSSATLGTNSVFGGNILAQAAVTVTTGTSIVGRTFGMTAKVSTDTNVISIAACPVAAPPIDAGLPDAEGTDADIDDAADAEGG
jgi:hypothetical protein